MKILAAFILLAAQMSPPPEENYGPHGSMRDMTCPVGGEHFRALDTGSYSTMGARPDGRPGTYWFMPLPLPECPSNGLVLFDEFTPAQIAALTPLIASPDYRRLRATDSTYYRAQWLATRVGMSEQAALWMLLSATWQVKPGNGPIGQPMPSPAKARQYQVEFVARVRALPPNPREPSYIALFARAANAERELGHFQAAATMLARLRGWLAHPDPAQWEDAESRPEDWVQFADALARVVARRETALQPLDMADEFDAAWLCIGPALPNTPFNRAFCARPELREGIARARQVRAEAEQPPSR